MMFVGGIMSALRGVQWICEDIIMVVEHPQCNNDTPPTQIIISRMH